MSDLADRLLEPGVFADRADELRRAQGEQWTQALRIARMHADVFATEPGMALLKYWVQVFVARSIVRPNDDAYAQGIREGQADVVRQILAQLEVARTGPRGE